MPPPTTAEDILTPEQVQFVSKYLKSRPKKKKKRAEQEAYNEDVTKQYKEYLKYKALAEERLRKVKLQAQSAEIRYGASGGQDDAFETALETYKTKMKGFDSRIQASIRKAETAEEDSPVFEAEAQQLKTYYKFLLPMRRTPPVPLPGTGGPGKERLLAYFDESIALRGFSDVKEFDRAAAETKLKDSGAEKRRVARLKEHDEMVDEVTAKIATLLATSGNTVEEQGAAGDEAEALLIDLRKKRKPIIASLAMRLAKPAIEELGELAKAGDPIALREVDRLEKISTSRETLKTASRALRKQIKAKNDKIAGKGRDLDENPIGFAEMKKLRAELADLTSRREDAIARSRQLLHYIRSAPERVAKIESNKQDLVDAQEYLTDLDGKIAEDLAANHSGPPPAPTKLEPWPESHKVLLLGGKAVDGKGDKDGNVNGRYQELKAKFQRSHERVSVDAKLFPTEKGLTDINDEQFKVLNDMLEKAKGMAVGGKLAEADFLMNEAAKLHLKFLGSNKFELPDLEEEIPTASSRVEKAIQEITVALDRFWGRGGDDKDVLRKRLNAIVDARAISDPAKQMSAGEAEKKLEILRADLLKAEAAFRPSPQDKEARDKAQKTQQQLNGSLLKLYETSVVSPSDLGKVSPDNLITVIGADGKPEYHEIKTERGGTRKVLKKGTKVPLEVVMKLEDQAAMLAVLSAGEAPDCAAEIEAAIANAAQLSANAENGGEDYDYIHKLFPKIEKLLENSDFQLWTPVNLDPCRTEFEHFKKTYKEMPKVTDAKAALDTLYGKIEKLTDDVTRLKIDYKDVSLLFDQLDESLKGGKGADEKSPGNKLQALLKGGEKEILKGVDTGPLGVQDMIEMNRLIEGIKSDITKLLATGKHSSGYESTLKKDLAAARQTLDARTQKSITAARAEARRIKDALKAEMDALDAKKPADGLDYIREIAAFMTKARTGAEAVKTVEEDMEKAKTAAKEALASAKEKLDEAKYTLASYKEYKAVYNSIETQVSNTGKTYKKSKDADWAKSQYDMFTANAEELLKDLQKFTPINTPGKPIDLSKWQTALDTNIAKVASSAESATAILEKKAQEDDEQKNDTDLQDAVTKAAKAMRAAKKVAVAASVKLNDKLQQRATDLFANTNDSDRKAGMAVLREDALAEVRRIRSTLEADPALAIYRNNPFDHGLGWAQFIATLHTLDVTITTELKPR